MSDFVAKKNKMRAALASKCQQSSTQPGEEENSNPIEINGDENDEEETTRQPIPVQIGHRPGVIKPQYNRQLAVDDADVSESEAGCTA